jgi:hypothetical protein
VTVGQLGQHIVVRQKLDALLVELAVGDVDGNADVVGPVWWPLPSRTADTMSQAG